MSNEVKIAEFDLIDDVNNGNIVNILNQIADRAWNQNMGNWFVSCIDRAIGRYYALELKEDYLRYIRNAGIILPAQQKAYLIGDVRDLLVRVFQASQDDLEELGMPEVKVTTSNVNSVLLSTGKKMWQHEWEADFIELLDRRMHAPKSDHDDPFTNTMSGADYDQYLTTITDSHNLDILHEILTAIITQVNEIEEVRDVLDADNFFIQK